MFYINVILQMPKPSRRNRTKPTVKTITVKTKLGNVGNVSFDILSENLDDFKYYFSKCRQMKLAVSTYETIANQGLPDTLPQADKALKKYLKTRCICSAHYQYRCALDANKTLLKIYMSHDKVNDKKKEIFKLCAKVMETSGNLYIYLHNKNYDKSLEYYVKLQKLFNTQLDMMMFDDLSKVDIGTQRGLDGTPVHIDKDESVRCCADAIKAQNNNIKLLWTNFFNTDPPVVALE